MARRPPLPHEKRRQRLGIHARAPGPTAENIRKSAAKHAPQTTNRQPAQPNARHHTHNRRTNKHMPIQPANRLWNNLGWIQWGDIGELTCYRRPNGQVVWFAKTYPAPPPSPLQAAERARWSAAAQNWQQAPLAQKQAYEAASHRASLCMTGYNLWLMLSLTPDPEALQTLASQTQTTLVSPPPV